MKRQLLTCLEGSVGGAAALWRVHKQIQLCRFAARVMFAFVSESCFIFNVGNGAAAGTGIFKAVFLSSPRLERVTTFEYVLV